MPKHVKGTEEGPVWGARDSMAAALKPGLDGSREGLGDAAREAQTQGWGCGLRSRPSAEKE